DRRRRDALLESRQRDRAIHGARVQIGEAERIGDAARDARLAGPGGPVDRHDGHPRRRARSAANRGYDTAPAPIPTTTTPARRATVSPPAKQPRSATSGSSSLASGTSSGATVVASRTPARMSRSPTGS